ncbi:MAG: glycosyltransferase family 2 protein [Phycisphaerales bacterium]
MQPAQANASQNAAQVAAPAPAAPPAPGGTLRITPDTRPASMVEPKPRGRAVGGEAGPLPRIAVLIVTWNRKDMVAGVLDALQRQDYPADRLDVVVIDNASTDGTLEALTRNRRPDLIVDNPTDKAHHPDFRPRPVGERMGNKPGFASLTVIRNGANLGGCGGFNTGLSYVEQALAADRGTRLVDPDASAAAASSRPEFAWLVDDDVDLPPDTLRRLVEAMRSDDAIGLVGSRTVDIRDRRTTIETTIYQDQSTGLFADQPDERHPRKADHDAWAASVGGVKGRHEYHGLRDVDIVSACSMLARWSAVEKVGFWDHRYFIYCDDADWCLRFARAGYRVVLNLDAVVFHTPWHHKLTPARLYYAQRNLLWTIRKTFEPARLREVMGLRSRTLLRQSLQAGMCHRLSHAEIMRRSLDDAIRGRDGKLELEAAKPRSLNGVAAELLGGSASAGSTGVAGVPPAAKADPESSGPEARNPSRTNSTGAAGVPPATGSEAGSSGPEARNPSRTGSGVRELTVAFVLARPIALGWASGLRRRLRDAVAAHAGVKPGDMPIRWFECLRNDFPGAHELEPASDECGPVERIVYASHWKSRLRRQTALIKRRADLLVIFDNAADLPLVRPPRFVLQIDSSRPTEGVLEKTGTGPRLSFLRRWLGTAMRARGWVARITPAGPDSKYGRMPASATPPG